MPSIRNCVVILAILVLLLPAGSRAADVIIDAGRGPVVVHVPPSYDEAQPTPLMILLHGYGASGALQEEYMQFTPLSDEYGFLYSYPDGTRSFFGLRFWNATDACCAFFDKPDDSGYLLALIDKIKSLANVDPQRVYLVGHSNGGFMSYRMACDHSDTIAAIASLAGANWLDPTRCAPTEPVHILQIHGTQDETIGFDGGCTLPGACYPGALGSLRQWVVFNDCDLPPDLTSEPIDLDSSIPGDETLVAKAEAGCVSGGSAELWAIVQGSHAPFLSSDFSRLVIEYLLSHPK